MSETQQQKAAVKGKGLGRGLGSLLGAGDDGAFSKTTPAAERVLEKLTESLPSQVHAPIRQGFIESQQAAETQVPANPAPTVAPTPAPVAAPAPAPVVAAPAVPNHLRIWQVPIEKIDANPDQPRQIFDAEPLQELANSIREKGIIQPLLLRKKGENFEIIAGERRWRAAQLAGLKEVPAILKESGDREVQELALIENIQRENLNPVEEAEAYDFLIKKYNLTQLELAQKVGKDRATVTNLLRLLQLQPSVRQMVSKKELSLGQAKVLLSLVDASAQEKLALKAKDESLSVRALEKLVAQKKDPVPTPALSEDDELRAMLAKDLGDELQKLVGSKVVLDYDRGKGKISIQFYSDDELNEISERLRKAWHQQN